MCPRIMPLMCLEAAAAAAQHLGEVGLRDKKIEALALVNERAPVARQAQSAMFHRK
jgi:hypothetical protein